MRTLCLLSLLTLPARADEGMWLFNAFPSEKVKEAYGATVDEAWLNKVRLGSVRLANGCSASFVSPQGLVMTNHHCIRTCLEDLSTPQRDLLAVPFFAATPAAEERCPKVEANQLTAITDVTPKVLAATAGLAGAQYQAALKATQAALEAECSAGAVTTRCDLVTLFNGAQFHLYRYRRFQDVRLVFTPEFDMATFGGDGDNFNFPRTGTDFAFLRVWEEGKPRATPEALRFAATPVKEGELVFTSGHPGGTERNRTVAQLRFARDVSLMWSLLSLAELRGRMDSWMEGDAERTRVTRSKLRAVENSLKALRGRYEALVAPGFLEKAEAREAAVRAASSPAAASAFDAIAAAMAAQRPLFADARLLEGAEAYGGELFRDARALVRLSEESKKPNGERLPEYTDARKPLVVQQLTRAAPVSKALETALLTWSLQKLRNLKGADAQVVREALGKDSPEELAAALIQGTRLDDAAFRAQVLEGKVPLESDPLLRFAKQVDASARAVRKQLEDTVEAPVKKAFEEVTAARRAALGTQGYPDATFTLRLSYGAVKGFGEVKPLTTVGQFYARATGKAPFAASPAWLSASKAMDPKTPFNLTTTNDIIGGNSGSPLVDRRGDVVGLVFDGNLPSLGGNFGYEPKDNRTVAVHGSLILAALRSVYGAQSLARELTGK